ncbi:MAG: dihydrofolate reductase [Parcubacteria group bacterium]|nr:dihydrofolate reductase [Parcubacteria group bacterium]
MISLIAAMGRNRVIGNRNTLPWKLPADMKRFRELTRRKMVIMGKSTFDSIGKPLPNRTNIVITGQDIEIPGCFVTHSIDSAILHGYAGTGRENGMPWNEVMVIGGASIYTQFLPRANRLYLTYIDEDFEGDAWFPIFENPEIWEETERIPHNPDNENKYAYAFVTYERKKNVVSGI